MFTLALDKDTLTQKHVEDFAVHLDKLSPKKRSKGRFAVVRSGSVVRAAISAGWFSESPAESEISSLPPRKVRDMSAEIDRVFSAHVDADYSGFGMQLVVNKDNLIQLHLEDYSDHYDRLAEGANAALPAIDIGLNVRAAVAAGWFGEKRNIEIVDTMPHALARELTSKIEDLYKEAVLIDPN